MSRTQIFQKQDTQNFGVDVDYGADAGNAETCVLGTSHTVHTSSPKHDIHGDNLRIAKDLEI